MLFNSIEFLFVFLPLVLLGFLLLQRVGNLRLVMLWLVVSSLFFYAWWNPIYLLLLAVSACVNYSLGSFLSRSEPTRRGNWLTLGVLFNLLLLGYFKYANFFVDSIGVLANTSFHLEHIVLPLAISFYTFQQITYLVDARKGLTQTHGFLDYCLFVCFFPQLIAGPIVHHSDMLKQFSKLVDTSQTTKNLTVGASILIIGLFKKTVIADSFALFATPVFELAAAGQELFTLDAVAGGLSYAFQLYFDFSGYSDMAIGLACMFGIMLPVNFFSPYRAQNISDFWRMWHATLSRFLRDYVYRGLGGFMCSPNRQRFNLFATMLLGGVWHGAGWTFVVYGLCHGVYVVVHQLWRIKVSGPLGLVPRRGYRMFAQVFTFAVIALTLVVFRAETLTEAARIYTALLDWNGGVFVPAYSAQLQQTQIFGVVAQVGLAMPGVGFLYTLLGLALAACWILPSTYQLFRHCGVMIDRPLAGREAVLKLQWSLSRSWAVAIALMAVMSMMNLTQVSDFLYFQF